MDRKPRVLAFAGSARVDSYNSKLVKVAAEGVRAAGAEVTWSIFVIILCPCSTKISKRREGYLITLAS